MKSTDLKSTTNTLTPPGAAPNAPAGAPLTPVEAEAIFTLCLLAAFADGTKDERERDALIELIGRLPDRRIDTGAALNRVLFKQVDLVSAAAQLHASAARQQAFEMALCVAEVDGRLTPPELAFLTALGAELELPPEQTAEWCRRADTLTVAALAQAGEAGSLEPLLTPASAKEAERREAEAKSLALNYALLNGALELLPQSLATLAVVPLQMKMVYRIGRLYGFELDRGHIRDFLGVAGIGLASQVVETYARKFLSGLVGKAAGGLGRKLAGPASSSLLTFAITYALGQLAQVYYADGRRLAAPALRERFAALSAQAQDGYERHAPEIKQRARSINLQNLLPLIKSQ